MASAAVWFGSVATSPGRAARTSTRRWPSTPALPTPCANASPGSAAFASPRTPAPQRVETDPLGGLTLVSEYVQGWRLADLLDVAEAENLTLRRRRRPAAAAPAAADGGDAVEPEAAIRPAARSAPSTCCSRPQGRVVLTDYVLGSAIETLGWDRRPPVAVAAGRGAADRHRRPGRVAARRRRPGRRDHAVAGRRPPSS